MGHKAFPQCHTGHLIETPTHLPWEGGAGACSKGLLTQLGGHRAWAQVRTCLLSVLTPPWSCLVPWEGEGTGGTGQERLPLPVGSGPAAGPLPRPHAPRGCRDVFLPESPCYPSCFAALGLHGQNPSQIQARVRGSHAVRVERPGLQVRRQGWQQGHPWAGGLRESGCRGYLRGRKLGCGQGRRLPQTGRPTGPGQGGSEGWRGGTQVGRFPGQGAKQICV